MKKVLTISLSLTASLLIGAPASDTNVVAGFRVSSASNYNLLLPVSQTNSPYIQWTNTLFGITASNSTFSGNFTGRFTGDGGALTNLPVSGLADFLWKTNAHTAGMSNAVGPIDVMNANFRMGTGAVSYGSVALINIADGSGYFAEGNLGFNGGGSIFGPNTWYIDGFDGAAIFGGNIPYSTNFFTVVVPGVGTASPEFEIDSTSGTVRAIEGSVMFTNHTGGSIRDLKLAPNLTALGTDSESHIVASTGGSGGVTIYTNTSPTAEGVLPNDTNSPAISYKLDGTDMMYTWNTNTFTWQ